MPFFVLIFVLLLGTLHAVATAPVTGATLISTTHHTFSFYPAQLKEIVDKIQQLEEVRSLIGEVKKNGRIGIEIAVKGNFEAMWDSTNRVISVNPNRHSSEATLIVSLLFELHNAGSDQELKRLITAAQQGNIDKETFVYLVEKMEHNNCLKTCAILESGVKQGIFPKETQWDIFYSFEEHYQVQQISGHSHWLAKSYERYNPAGKQMPFQGTIEGLFTLTNQDRNLLWYYLRIKNGLKSKNPMKALMAHKKLQHEYTCFAQAPPRSMAHPTLLRRQALFRSVFSRG